MTVKRIILDAEADDVHGQLDAAVAALRHGRPRDGLLGLSMRGRHYAVKWNVRSVRVYPQERDVR